MEEEGGERDFCGHTWAIKGRGEDNPFYEAPLGFPSPGRDVVSKVFGEKMQNFLSLP